MNTFGRFFRISIFGESHGRSLGIMIDGCPPGIPLIDQDFFADLERRRSRIKGTSARHEMDYPNIQSGVFNDITTGAPILIQFNNEDLKSQDYSILEDIPRPGHVDFVTNKKYNGFNDFLGGGHFSGRLSLGLVAAGVIAKKILHNIIISSNILSIGGKTDFSEAIDKVMEEKDSLGGLVECIVDNVPIGLGEPFFDSVESLISHLVFSIPGIKGIEFGSGFKSVKMKGSEHNDPIINSDGKTSTNNAGGVNGGITNGNQIIFRVAVKPTSSIAKKQNTLNLTTEEIVELEIKGRHDCCIALRMPPILEAVAAIVLADLMMINKAIYKLYS